MSTPSHSQPLILACSLVDLISCSFYSALYSSLSSYSFSYPLISLAALLACCCWCLVLSCCCCCSGYQLQSGCGEGRGAVEAAAAAASSLSWHVDKDQCLAGLRFNIVSVSLALRCWHTLPRFGAWPWASVESGSSSRMMLLELFHHLPRGWWMAPGLNINSHVCVYVCVHV